VSSFHVLRSRTRFWRYRWRWVPFSSFALADSFSTLPRVSWLVFMFCAPGLFLSGTEGVESRFHVLHSRTLFGRYRGSRLVFKFCAPGHVFGGTEGVESRFHVLRSRTLFGRYWRILRSRTRFWRYRGRRGSFSCFALPDSFWAVQRASDLVFVFCASGLVSGGTVGLLQGYCWN
jgi:hypothetical protein